LRLRCSRGREIVDRCATLASWPVCALLNESSCKAACLLRHLAGLDQRLESSCSAWSWPCCSAVVADSFCPLTVVLVPAAAAPPRVLPSGRRASWRAAPPCHCLVAAVLRIRE